MMNTEADNGTPAEDDLLARHARLVEATRAYKAAWFAVTDRPLSEATQPSAGPLIRKVEATLEALFKLVDEEPPTPRLGPFALLHCEHCGSPSIRSPDADSQRPDNADAQERV